jgi:hypothetical protein
MRNNRRDVQSRAVPVQCSEGHYGYMDYRRDQVRDAENYQRHSSHGEVMQPIAHVLIPWIASGFQEPLGRQELNLW